MHATDFLPILNTSRMLFCALANCTIRWDPTRSVAIMEFCCNPFFLQSCELYGSGATLWQTGKFLAWILGSELWASFMQCVILVRGFQWAKLTSANREWLYLPHSHKKTGFTLTYFCSQPWQHCILLPLSTPREFVAWSSWMFTVQRRHRSEDDEGTSSSFTESHRWPVGSDEGANYSTGRCKWIVRCLCKKRKSSMTILES